MSSKQEHPIQAMGFWLFGFLCVVMTVLKLTVAGYWSWWRVILPFLAFLGHNAVHVLVGDCQRLQSRARLNPETMTVSFEEFSPTHEFFDYTSTRTASTISFEVWPLHCPRRRRAKRSSVCTPPFQ